jgi:hypothetical protein
MSTCNRLDLQTLGSQPTIMPKISLITASVCKSDRLHVDILWFSFYYIGAYSITSSKTIRHFPAVSNFNRLLLKLNRLMCN